MPPSNRSCLCICTSCRCESEAFPLPRHLQGEHLRAALPEALTAIVVALARRATTLVLLEDWHWADEASRDALRRLLEIVDAHALMIVVTSRPEPGALAGGADGAARIQLAPLAGDASAAIMRAVLHVDRVSDALAARVHERTGGNPFFLEQVCRTLLEEDAVTTHDGEAVAASGVEVLRLPDTVQAVIRARLDRLDRDSRDVLRVASVIGREFGRVLLGEVLGPGADPTAALERLKGSGLIQQTAVLPEPTYRFRHVLTQEVAYDSLLERQRRSLHEVVGRTIERCHANRGSDLAPLLAHHFAHAEAWREAVHYGSRAAERAASLTQFADALTTLERVRGWIAHLPDDDARTDALVDLLLHQERLSETLGLRGRQQQIVEELIALLAPRGASASLAQAYLRQGDVATLLKRFDAAERTLSTALRLSRELGEAALERNTLRSIGLLRWHQGRHADALTIARERAGDCAGDRRRPDGRGRSGEHRDHSEGHGRLPKRAGQPRGSAGDTGPRPESIEAPVSRCTCWPTCIAPSGISTTPSSACIDATKSHWQTSCPFHSPFTSRRSRISISSRDASTTRSGRIEGRSS